MVKQLNKGGYKMYIKVKFLDANYTPKGRDYTYQTELNTEPGEVLLVKDSKVMVTETNVDEKEVQSFIDKIKIIEKRYEPETEEFERDNE